MARCSRAPRPTAGNDFGLDVAPDRPSSELVFWTDDSDAAYAAALAAGGTGAHEPVDSADARLHYGWVRDPPGHLLKLVQAPVIVPNAESYSRVN